MVKKRILKVGCCPSVFHFVVTGNTLSHLFKAYDMEMLLYSCHNLVLATSNFFYLMYILQPKSMQNLCDFMMPCALHIYILIHGLHFSLLSILTSSLNDFNTMNL